MEPDSSDQDLPNGPVAAAMVAGGLGSATIGLLTVLAEAWPLFSGALNWWNPAGPLTGKALTGVIIFFASWTLLHRALRNKSVNFALAATVALLLLGLGLLGTFPPFFDLFAPK